MPPSRVAALLLVSVILLPSASPLTGEEKPKADSRPGAKAEPGASRPKIARTLFRIPAAAEHLAYSPDGQLLAVSGSEGHFKGPVALWDIAAGKELHRFRHRPGSLWNLPSYFHPPVVPLAFSPDGKSLAYPDGQAVVVVATDTGKERHRLATLQDPEAIAFAPDGASVAVAGRVKAAKEDFDRARKRAERGYYVPPPKRPEVQIWDLPTGNKRSAAVGKSAERIIGLSFRTPKQVVALLEDRERVYELHTGKTIVRRPEHGFDAVALSPDGTLLAFTVRYAGLTRVIEVATGKSRCRFAARPTAGLRFSPDNRLLAAIIWTGPRSRAVEEWDVARGKQVVRLAEIPTPSPVAYAPDGHSLATGHSDGTVRWWPIKAP